MLFSFRWVCFTSLCKVLIIIFGLVIAPSCGKSEEKKGAESETLVPPVIESVKILPERPLSSSYLQAVVKSQGFTPVEYVYSWKRNGEEIIGEEESTLKSEHFFKGDRIEVEVIPYREKVKGMAKKSGPVLILNSPPNIKSVAITPSPAYSKDDLHAEVDAFDPDGDYIRYAYQWKKGDEEIPGEIEATLSSSHFKRGDKISYWVSMTDGESKEIVLHSNASSILNSAPCITSQPSGIIEGFLYEYEVAAEDPDGDPLKFSLSSAPEGMTIDSATGVIRWNIGERQRKGSYEFKVIVSDTEGAKAVQPITLNVSS